MQTLAKQILGQAAGAPEGTPMVAKELLHLPKLESQRALRSKKKDTPKSRQENVGTNTQQYCMPKAIFIGACVRLTQ